MNKNINYFTDLQLKGLQKQYAQTKMYINRNNEAILRKKKVEKQNAAQVETDYNAVRQLIERNKFLKRPNEAFIAQRNLDLEKLIKNSLY
jgi:hypothetical protein